MSDTLTLDALVEDVARAIQKRAETLDPGVTWEEWVPEAEAALAAVAKRMGDPDRLRVGALALAADAVMQRKVNRPLASALDDCAALLRTLAEAAP